MKETKLLGKESVCYSIELLIQILNKDMIQRISITKINCEIVPVDSNLPSGERFPPFEQLGPDFLKSTCCLVHMNPDIFETANFLTQIREDRALNQPGKRFKKDAVSVISGFLRSSNHAVILSMDSPRPIGL